MKYVTNNSSLLRLSATIGAGVLALGLAGPAAAHGGGHGDDGYRGDRGVAEVHYRYYDEPRYRHGKHHRGHGRRHAPSEVVYVYERREVPVEVVRVYERREVPVEVVRVYEPAPRVVERRVEHYSSGYEQSRGNPPINGGSLIGAAIGGLLGAQVGGGSGKLAATAAGAVGGFLLGDHASNNGYR